MRRGVAILIGVTSAVSLAAKLVAGQAAKPRILLFYDMEGISGANRVEQVTFSSGAPYQQARQFLTGDVNAAIRGLVAGGAGDILVTDAHGSGNPEPDILLDQMHKRATFEWREQRFDPYSDSPNASFRAIVCIAMHARANTPGFMAHTYTIHPSFRVNGQDLTETEIIAHSAARYGIPVIMVSGDDVLQKQIAERFPGAEYGLVKRAKGPSDAELLPAADAQKNIETAAKRAMEKLAQFKPYAVAHEYRWEMGWQNPTQTDLAMEYAGVTRVSDRSVGYTTKSFVEGYNRAVALIEITGGEQYQLLLQLLLERSDGTAILDEWQRRIEDRWFNPAKYATKDSGRPAKKRYHGAN